MTKKNQHVVPHPRGWAVKSAGNSRATSVHGTQREAVAAAREIAMRRGSEMLVHGKDGRIRERNTYGKDPFPSQGLIPRDRCHSRYQNAVEWPQYHARFAALVRVDAEHDEACRRLHPIRAVVYRQSDRLRPVGRRTGGLTVMRRAGATWARGG